MIVDVDILEGLLNLEDDPTPEQLDTLESTLGYLNETAGEGNPAVADDVYDVLKVLAETYAPDSLVLQRLWDEVEEVDGEYDELDIHLQAHPMQSIRTVKSWDNPDVQSFPLDAPLHFSTKIDGHGIRVVYKDGIFARATSRARHSRGRDLTEKVRSIVPATIDYGGVVEVRGELCLPIDRLEMARELTGKELKNSFTAVSSLIAPQGNDENASILTFEAYKIFVEDKVISSITDQYIMLDKLGFSTPYFETYECEGEDTLEDVFNLFVEGMESPYICDGVVCAVDGGFISGDHLYSEGSLALKVGKFSQSIYQGVVERIEWKTGRTKLSPVAVLEDGVLTQHGTRVRNVPLYEPVNILHLGAYVGKVLNFKYGGEAGVVPCFPDGTLLTQSILPDITIGN